MAVHIVMPITANRLLRVILKITICKVNQLHRKPRETNKEAHFLDSLIGTHMYQFGVLLPKAGIEPARYCYRRILSPVRLPIPPLGLKNKKAPPGFEPGVKELQSSALPLGYSTKVFLFA